MNIFENIHFQNFLFAIKERSKKYCVLQNANLTNKHDKLTPKQKYISYEDIFENT